MSAFDKTRVFDRNAIEELRRNSTELMQTADEVSERMEEEIKALQQIMHEVPSEAKHHGLESTLSRVKGTLHVEDFKDCEDTMQKVLMKLEDDIPMYDKKMAEEMSAITQSTEKLCSRINDLTQLAGTGSGGGTYQGFLDKLQNCKHEWDAESANLSEELKRIQACMKGVELYSSVFSTDPVNLVTGNFIYEKEDLKIKALYPLTFKRFYNAINEREGSLSKGWIHNHEVQLILEKKTDETEKKEVRILLEDGREEIFSQAADGNYQEYRGSSSTLTEIEDSYQYHTAEQKTYTFDVKGNLKRSEDRNGNGASYTYENEQLQKVQCDTGESLSFQYHENGKLIQITDHTNRCVELSYEEDRLFKVQQADGTTYQYSYTKKGTMEAVQNALQIQTVKNLYDAKNRVKEQHFPDGGVMSYQYKDREGLTILTEQNGNQITYQHDDRYRHTQTRYADGTEKYTYNKRNRKVSFQIKEDL